MNYLFFVLLFFVTATSWAMEFHSCENVEEFLAYVKRDKENSVNASLPPGCLCSLQIDDQKNLQKFLKLDEKYLPAINKISFSVNGATPQEIRAFKKFFSDHRASFKKLRVFISSGLALGNDFAQLLTKMPELTQIDLIGADLTNEGFRSLIATQVSHINVMNNPSINPEVINEILPEIKSGSDLTLILGRTQIEDAQEEPLRNKGITLFVI